MIVVCSDNPGCVGFVESVAVYRKEKPRADAMEKRAAALDATIQGYYNVSFCTAELDRRWPE